MNRSMKIAAALLLVPSLLFAVSGVQSVPLGEVVAGGNVTVGNTPMPRGATIFEGDVMKGGGESSVVQFSSNGKIELYPGAASDVVRSGERVLVRLHGGKVAYSLPRGSQLLFDTPRVSIRTGADAELFVGTIERQEDSAVVQPVQGEMIVQNKETGETATVRPGESAICVVGGLWMFAGDPYTATKFPWLLVTLGSGAAVATGIIVHEVVTDEKPASPSGR